MAAPGYTLEGPESSRPECASANGFANETGRDGGDDVRHRRRPARPSPGQRDVLNVGDGETRVVWLITQRSRVQIPPPLLVSAGQGPFLVGRGPFVCRAL